MFSPRRCIKQELSQTHLDLNLGLGNILLATVSTRNLLGLLELGLDILDVEVLERITLNGVDGENRVGLDDGESTGNCMSHVSHRTHIIASDGARTEERLGAAGLLDDLNQTGLQLLNRRNVVGEDTHGARLGLEVDLDDILGLVDGLEGCGTRYGNNEKGWICIVLPTSAAEQQALVAREVDRSLVNIRDLSTQTAAGATQTSAASQELSRLAVDLNGMVTRFVL